MNLVDDDLWTSAVLQTTLTNFLFLLAVSLVNLQTTLYMMDTPSR